MKKLKHYFYIFSILSTKSLLGLDDDCIPKPSYAPGHHRYEVRHSGEDFVRVVLPKLSVRRGNVIGNFAVSSGVRKVSLTTNPDTGRVTANISLRPSLGPNSTLERVDITKITALIPSDATGDGLFDERDLEAVVNAFGQNFDKESCPKGGGRPDINKDGKVDDADLLLVLFKWGEES
ncbi:MAG: dockerin type I domain-containing protein, partial [Deltaproteobacteria bacterium]|nr:dockerin type I domain-containing protein [Deltaproteobacteria bacterium]